MPLKTIHIHLSRSHKEMFSCAPQSPQSNMKIPLFLLIGQCGVMTLKINSCLAKRESTGNVQRLCVCRTHIVFCCLEISYSVCGPLYFPPQNDLIKSQRSCGHVIMTVYPQIILYPVRLCQAASCVIVYLGIVFCGGKPQCFCPVSLTGMYTHIHTEFRGITKRQCVQICSDMCFITQPNIKAMQSPQTNSEIGF